MTIALPEQLRASGLLPSVSRLGDTSKDCEVVLDFAKLRRITPAGLVLLAATVVRWRQAHRNVTFRGLKHCAVTGYLQRMDLLKVCGCEWPEEFLRHESKGRFVPVRLVDHRVDEMGNEVAACLAPGGEDYEHPMAGLYDLASYVFTETANNSRQHSAGLAYVAAQATRAEGMVRLALADTGVGIRGSFALAGFPWSREGDDAHAILRALGARVSSKPNDPNEGVGLTLVSGLARITRAWLLIVSGTGVLRISDGRPPELSDLPNGGCYCGTLLAMTFRERDAHGFARLLHNAKVDAGLLRTPRVAINFEP